MRAVNPVRAGTRSFQPPPILHYRAIIILSSTVAFIFFFFSLSLLPRLRQAASGGSHCSTNHFHPLSSSSLRLFPSALTDTSIPSISHSSVIRFSLAATPRHVRFPRERGWRRYCCCRTSRKVPVEESPLLLRPGRIGFCALNDSGSLLSPVIRRLDVHFSYSYHGREASIGMHFAWWKQSIGLDASVAKQVYLDPLGITV